MHPLKAKVPIDVIELGIDIDVRPVQPSKTLEFIDVTELGIVIVVRPVHNVYLLIIDVQ